MDIYGTHFESILQIAAYKEQQSIERPLEDIMFDEYRLDERTKSVIKQKDYQFPDVNIIKTDKIILIRKQNSFSVIMHHYKETTYFHKHDFIELIYVYKGKCRQYVDSFEHIIELREGDLFLLNQNVVHAIHQCDVEDIIVKIIIPTSFVSYEFINHLRHNPMLSNFFMNSKTDRNDYYNYLLFHTGFSEKTKLFVENIMMEFYSQDSFYKEAINSYLKLLMFEISRACMDVINVKYKIIQSSVETSEIMRYIYEHSDNITLEELSGVFSFNKSYLSRFIRNSFNKTFQEVVKGFRFEKAEYLLQNSDFSVEKIAQQVGYKNANTIFKEIRSKYGVTPLKYRNYYRVEEQQNSFME